MSRVTKRLNVEPENNAPDENLIKEIGLRILKDRQQQKIEVGDETYYCNNVIKNWYVIMDAQHHCLFAIDLEGLDVN